MARKGKKDYVAAIYAYLEKRFGKCNPEWDLTIDLLVNDIELYNACLDHIRKNGIWDNEKKQKNPFLTTIKELQSSITRSIQHLGISPWTNARIKNAETGDEEGDLLKNIMGL